MSNHAGTPTNENDIYLGAKSTMRERIALTSRARWPSPSRPSKYTLGRRGALSLSKNMKLIFFHYDLVFKPEMENSRLYSLESESSPVWLIQVCEVDMKWGRDSPK